ncbi:DUF4349 domain-containing protein [Candidatus Woesearchaeota archaeon]|nr:DUF4349 domain-containing protein [Candidatus Woesearchaeota archaeon]
MTLKEQFKTVKENWILALVVLAILLVPLFSGSSITAITNSGFDKGMAEMEMSSPRMGGVYYDQGDFAPEVTERKITKTAYLSSEVERGEFFDTEIKLKAIVSASDSILLNENVNKQAAGWKTTYYGYYQFKVKTTKYDAVIDQLKRLGEVESFSENSQDITGSYINLEEELGLEQDRLARYQAMYNQVSDISEKIALSDKIFNQERRVQYLEEALKNQDLRVEYSTVSVNLRETSSEYTNIALVKLSQLVRSVVNSFNAVLSLIFWALPWAALLLISWLVYRKVKR